MLIAVEKDKSIRLIEQDALNVNHLQELKTIMNIVDLTYNKLIRLLLLKDVLLCVYHTQLCNQIKEHVQSQFALEETSLTSQVHARLAHHTPDQTQIREVADKKCACKTSS